MMTEFTRKFNEARKLGLEQFGKPFDKIADDLHKKFTQGRANRRRKYTKLKNKYKIKTDQLTLVK